jgi:ApaG protein
MPSRTTAVTEGIRVSVRTEYLLKESSPDHSYYVFQYEIEINNESASPVRLLSRCWNIQAPLAQRQQVKGEGVVGAQPLIEPGKTFCYVSHCPLHSPIGQMSGYYCMERLDDQEKVQVVIPPFVLSVPHIYN